jgi:hypothetical protein
MVYFEETIKDTLFKGDTLKGIREKLSTKFLNFL